MSEQVDVDAGRENPEPFGKEDAEESLMVDAAIMKLLGFRFEVMDDFVKVWPKDVTVPDETNWLTGARFSRSETDCLALLEAMKVGIEFFEEASVHWAEVSLNVGEFMIRTTRTYSKEMAAAIALWSTLHAYRLGEDDQSEVT
jgi:hypothetical protein